MARKVKDQALDSREARGKLKVRDKPYYRIVEEGAHLGYRRLRGRAGTWCDRHYAGNQEYKVEGIGTADDLSDADGVAILSYWQAVDKVRERRKERAHNAAGITGPYTVKQALDDYLGWLDEKGKGGYDARKRVDAHVPPELGDTEIAKLTTDQLHKWHVSLAKQAPRLRTKPGDKQRHRRRDENSTADEWRRKRQASANRTLTIVKAACNRAWRAGKVASNAAWSRVEPFEAVDAARVRCLALPEATRLLNACTAEFRPMVQAALQTGCRYGELARLTAGDFHFGKQRQKDGTEVEIGTITVQQSKSGKPRHVVLTDEGVALFKELTAGRAGNALILPRSDGSAWEKSQQARPMAGVCKAARITPPVSFHILRHTWASHAVMNGVPLLVVAKNLGHADTRMVEKHYGHLAPSYIADAIRAGAPKFGFEPGKIKAIG
jgi:integrase